MNDDLKETPLVGEASLEELGGTPRVQAGLVVDMSGSMQGPAIDEVNGGMGKFVTEIQRDPVAADSIDLAIVTCSNVASVHQQFQPVAFVEIPQFQAWGTTPLCAGINMMIDLIQARREECRAGEVGTFKPWIVILSDGMPTEGDDEVRNTGLRVSLVERSRDPEKQIAVFAIGVGPGANMECLRRLTVRKPKRMKELSFQAMFSWLADSLKSVSQSCPGEQVKLPDPDDYGWSQI